MYGKQFSINLVKLARDRKHDRFPSKGSVLEGKWDPLFQGNLGW